MARGKIPLITIEASAQKFVCENFENLDVAMLRVGRHRTPTCRASTDGVMVIIHEG